MIDDAWVLADPADEYRVLLSKCAYGLSAFISGLDLLREARLL
jgi:hypothetical protein